MNFDNNLPLAAGPEALLPDAIASFLAFFNGYREAEYASPGAKRSKYTFLLNLCQ